MVKYNMFMKKNLSSRDPSVPWEIRFRLTHDMRIAFPNIIINIRNYIYNDDQGEYVRWAVHSSYKKARRQFYMLQAEAVNPLISGFNY